MHISNSNYTVVAMPSDGMEKRDGARRPSTIYTGRILMSFGIFYPYWPFFRAIDLTSLLIMSMSMSMPMSILMGSALDRRFLCRAEWRLGVLKDKKMPQLLLLVTHLLPIPFLSLSL